ncbi:hypothetical protein DC3_35700 [Deinococcus cellulosilyticus NBRC 106333 = KACC 11606]|uniref:Uncharacterized protein n=2 Tax=Deinococcus cellulosilyticus TaxID=401558 RepID=A0A511N512_DEIC1|nr:hypothetical protein DC3_35700 [Deinococcus cellulosilyticus NBRC 106333 = KACC 11606]
MWRVRWVVTVLLLGFAQAQMVLDFDRGDSKTHQTTQQVLSKSQYLKNVVRHFNDGLKLPQKITLQFLSCKQENAFYDPKKNLIQMCYELIDTYGRLEGTGKNSEKQLLNATLFTLVHEIGHALIDQLKLPATGREEDAVDQFATLALIALEDEDALLSGLLQFTFEASEETRQLDFGFADAHALGAQRLYNLVCLMYGSDKKAYRDLPKQFKIPENRLAQCAEEHQDALYAWSTLLKPHLKDLKKPLF